MPKSLDADRDLRRKLLCEDLERIHLKLRVEASLAEDTHLAKRLNDLAAEAEDSMLRVKAFGLEGDSELCEVR